MVGCTAAEPGNDAAQTSGSTGTSTSGVTGTQTSADGTESSSGSTSATTGGASQFDAIELRVQEFQVPTQETYYACFDFRLQLEDVRHIVGFEPVIDNAAHVHHFVVTSSYDPPNPVSGYRCDELPPGDLLWAWAPGQGEFMLPEDAGFKIGDIPSREITIRLQVHYNNPLGTGGQVDSSGFIALTTTELRTHDAGTMAIADVQGIEIPPGQAAYEHVTRCRSQTTQNRFEHPIHVFGSSLHAHDIGSVLYSELWRDGQLVVEFNRDDPYLFDSQNMKPVDLEIEPGDEIVNHCIYDSSERTGVTYGGLATSDEMCWNTIMYFPKLTNGFDYCDSSSL